MSAASKPIRSNAAMGSSKVERRVMCACYERCLDEAIRRRWHGFSCRKCPGFEPLELDLPDWLRDSIACLALIYVVEFQSWSRQKSRGSIAMLASWCSEKQGGPTLH